MVFENNDEFGVQTFRDDFEHLYNMNKIKVKHYIKVQSERVIKDDFLQLSLNQNDDFEYVELNVNSMTPKKKILTDEGYVTKGEVEYTAYVPANTNINEKSIIEFLSDYTFGIKKGDKFKPVFDTDIGIFQGQFGYISFKLIQI